MPELSEIADKIRGFLAGEFARTEGRVCIAVKLVASNRGVRDEPLGQWDRKDTPKYFDASAHAHVEDLASQVLSIAIDHVDGYGRGERSYVVRTQQALNGSMEHTFRLQPSSGSALSRADDPDGGIAGGFAPRGYHEPLTPVVRELLQTNTEMHRASFGTLARMHEDLRDRNAKLEAKLAQQEAELAALRADSEDRTTRNIIEMQKSERTDVAFKQFMQLANVVGAKMLGGPAGSPPAVMMLLANFGKSLSQPQVAHIMAGLSNEQRMMLGEIFQQAQAMANATPAGAGAGQAPGGSAGAAEQPKINGTTSSAPT